MRINELARLTGVTVRTLRYYDQIGLLKPSAVTEAGYRIYRDEALERMQQILFYRELDFSLDTIRSMLAHPDFDRREALKKQRELLVLKRRRLDGLIDLVDKTMNGDEKMDFQPFDMQEIEDAKKKYAQEVQARWGRTDAYAQSKKKTDGYSAAQWEEVSGKGAELLRAFALERQSAPDSAGARLLVEEWRDYISASYYPCTNEILSGLGQMYVGDERFMSNIDRNGEGTAAFMAKAIELYCAR